VTCPLPPLPLTFPFPKFSTLFCLFAWRRFSFLRCRRGGFELARGDMVGHGRKSKMETRKFSATCFFECAHIQRSLSPCGALASSRPHKPPGLCVNSSVLHFRELYPPNLGTLPFISSHGVESAYTHSFLSQSHLKLVVTLPGASKLAIIDFSLVVLIRESINISDLDKLGPNTAIAKGLNSLPSAATRIFMHQITAAGSLRQNCLSVHRSKSFTEVIKSAAR
jgi:hypothetical protein